MEEYSVRNPNQSYKKVDRCYVYTILEHLTTVIHVFVFIFTILIIYLCFSNEVGLMTWHPFLMTTGWLLIMSEGIMFLRPDNVFSKPLTPKSRSLSHSFVQCLAVSCSIAGFAIALASKIRNDRPHFTSNHGKVGFTAVLCSFVAAIGGIVAFFSAKMRRRVKPNLVKLLHGLFGIATHVLGGSAILMMVYSSSWFSSRTNSNEFLKVFSFVTVLLALVWVVAKPLLNSWKRVATEIL